MSFAAALLRMGSFSAITSTCSLNSDSERVTILGCGV